MKISTKAPELSLETTVRIYFQQSSGDWRSQRRYYTLKDGETQEVVSLLTVRFLEPGCDDLRQLARLHGSSDETMHICGAFTSWESNYVGPSPRQTSGSTIFGVQGNRLYRDRGFSSKKPIVAQFHMRDAGTMCLRTEYSGNVFEEEIRLVGSQYRTRQTIISRAREQIMIGQYLETRI